MNEPSLTATVAPFDAAGSEPKQLGRYRTIGRVGAGGMGTVFQVEDPNLHRMVAIKVPHLAASGRDRADAIQRFLRRANGSERGHPATESVRAQTALGAKRQFFLVRLAFAPADATILWRGRG